MRAFCICGGDHHGMYVRTVKVPSLSGDLKEYVRIIESRRERAKLKRRVMANLGAPHL